MYSTISIRHGNVIQPHLIPIWLNHYNLVFNMAPKRVLLRYISFDFGLISHFHHQNGLSSSFCVFVFCVPCVFYL